ncbi:MAG: alpha-amylase family glycosyl hydrolase [Bdellovibrionales bacterium]
MNVEECHWSHLKNLLHQLYDSHQVSSIVSHIQKYVSAAEHKVNIERKTFTQNDCMLICYGDHLQNQKPPLQSLAEFYNSNYVNLFNAVHLLPFYPSSSDGGFSVKDFESVCPQLGTWADIENFEGNLMFDAVVNHTSCQHKWFKGFAQGLDEFKDYYISFEHNDNRLEDYKNVTRPRSTPLFTSYNIEGRDQLVWTTFSNDQVDLNFRNHKILEEWISLIALYVKEGAKFLRIDATPFLWKKPNTTCANLNETHIIVKVFRAFLDLYSPDTCLITESNVPHMENIAYFGNGTDEAQIVYNFSLAPLILHGGFYQNAGILKKWAFNFSHHPQNQVFLNFTSTHDGIGMRPLEGLVDDIDVVAMCEHAQLTGGAVTTRTVGGEEKPYEINSTWMSFVFDERLPPEESANRFVGQHLIALCFPGVPAIYFHNMFGAFNDGDTFIATQHRRDLNRKRYKKDEFIQLTQEHPFHKMVFEKMSLLLRLRRERSYLSPSAAFSLLETPDEVFAFSRVAENIKGNFYINFSKDKQNIFIDGDQSILCSGSSRDSIDGSRLLLNPFSYCWTESKV